MRYSFFAIVIVTSFALAACGPSEEEKTLAKLTWDANGFNDQVSSERIWAEKENLAALKALKPELTSTEDAANVDEQIQRYEFMVKFDNAVIAIESALNDKQPDKAEKILKSLSSFVNKDTFQQTWDNYSPQIEHLRSLRIVVSKSITLTKTTFSEFKNSHPGADCFDLGEDSGCEIKSPSQADCPAQRPCSDVVYSFGGGELGYGFLAHYDQDSWVAWKKEFTDEFGEPELKHVDATRELPLGSDTYEWRRGGNLLTLMHFEGTDIYGAPPQDPYGMSFKAAAK